jgi:hypothetical protein
MMPSTNKHYGPGNPEWDARLEASLRGEHAPGELCQCNRCFRTGELGTVVEDFVFRPSLEIYEKYSSFLSFDALNPTEKRMSCLGMEQGLYGGWADKDGRTLQQCVQKRIAHSRLRRWAEATRARPYALHWIEHCAKAQEERRIAEVERMSQDGLAYDPLFVVI